MDILRPPLIWVDGRCFRTNVTQVNTQNAYEEEDDDSMVNVPETCDEPCDSKYEISFIKGEYQANPHVSNAYYGNIIGAKGSVRKRLESETRTHVRVPNSGEGANIRISGKNKRDVISALNRIDLIVESARQRQAFTHFLSLPFIDEKMKSAFVDFRTDVLRECAEARGVDRSIFQSPDKLHVTIGTMPLTDKFEREQALAMFDDCKNIVKAILGGKKLEVSVKGIEYMNDDPSEVDVLYAKVNCIDGSNKLQMLADELVEKFVCEGLMQKQYERVKIHITIMNTLFRQNQDGVVQEFQRQHKTGRKQRESFDANGILEKFGDYSFGEYVISDIHLSQRYHVGSNGFYSCTGKLELLP